MSGMLGIAVLTGISCLIGYLIPDLSYSFAGYKSMRKGYPMPRRKPDFRWSMFSMLFTASAAGMSGYLLPIDQAVFVVMICHIAVFGICVDTFIRIIANEMLWVILAAGLFYRIYSGGLHALWGSAGALLLVIAVFGMTVLFTFAMKRTAGVGMGDVKLSMIIAVTVGWPGVFYFLTGMAGAVGIYCLAGMKCGFLVRESTFPMCGHMMAGFLIALLWPHILMTVL